MAKDMITEKLESPIEEWADETFSELQEQGKEIADNAIKAVSKKVQEKFIDNIEDEAIKQAASSTVASSRLCKES